MARGKKIKCEESNHNSRFSLYFFCRGKGLFIDFFVYCFCETTCCHKPGKGQKMAKQGGGGTHKCLVHISHNKL